MKDQKHIFIVILVFLLEKLINLGSNDKWIVLEKLQKLYEEWLKMRLDESIYEALLSSIRSIGDFARESIFFRFFAVVLSFSGK